MRVPDSGVDHSITAPPATAEKGPLTQAGHAEALHVPTLRRPRKAVRVVGATACAALALAFGACGGSEGAAGGGAAKGGAEEAFKPTRDVKMLVPYAPGGGADQQGRELAAGIEEVHPDVNVTVENRPGGDSSVGYTFLKSQQGNPHYLMATETASLSVPITTDVAYKWRDFTPLALIAEDATFLVANCDSPYKSGKDLVEAARQGKKVSVGVAGVTSQDAIVTKLLERDQNVKFDKVVFDAGGEMVAAVVGGQIDAASVNPGESLGQIRSGDVCPLFTFANKRYESEVLAKYPTAKEEGFDITFSQYRGYFAPGGIEPAAQDYWTKTIVDWTKKPSYQEYVKNNQMISNVLVGAEFEKYLADQEKLLNTILADEAAKK